MTQGLPRVARWLVLASALAGGAGGFFLFRSFKDPCGGLLRRYAAAYDAAKPCRADVDCVVDPMPPRGPGLCDRARAAAGGRERLGEIEVEWARAGCPAPGTPCPLAMGPRCERGRCVTALR